MNETIVAIATAVANNAISIIRVSGSEAISIVDSVFKGKHLLKVKSHTIHYGYIKEKDSIYDEVLVSVFRAPKTFTKEDIVEVNCHGGIFVTNKILELLVVKGARIAEPGEFTKRAFLNGRIDLTQAEAVMDVIQSQTTNSLKMAGYGLTGETKKIIKDFRQQVLSCIASIEVNIDYPEYEEESQINNDLLKPNILSLIKEIDLILKKAEVSQIIKNGLKTAIIGRPNVGKSSLLNALLREDKAIVTNIAGTTRDIIEGEINIGGLVLHLIDTAGVRSTDDLVEKLGVEKTKKILQESELIILVFDHSDALTNNDLELLDLTINKNRIIVVNKSDLDQKIDLKHFDDYILLSSFNAEDIFLLEQKIKDICNVADIKNIDASYIGNARQLAKLKIAKDYLYEALNGIAQGFPIDIINIDINHSWIALGEILGEVSSEDLLDELFKNFCLGK